MTKLSNKELIDQIKKYAVPVPKAPPGYGGVPAPSPGSKPIPRLGPQSSSVMPTSQYSESSSSSVTAVKEMQEAMQGLASAVIQDAQSGTMGAKPQDQIQPGATVPVKSSKKAFNDFIAEQYVGSLESEHKGVEWTTDKKVTTLPGKKQTQTDIYELDVVMNTLQRIGMQKSEFKVDGVWDFRTDNALRNMMGFGYALLQLEGDFGLSNNIYSYNKWQAFQATMSGYKIENGKVKLSPAQKEERAAKITAHLKAITKLYTHFRQQVTARPEYRPLIEGKRAFEKYNPAGNNKDILTSVEKQYSQSDVAKIENITHIAPALPSKKMDYIPLKALTSREAYMKYMMEYCGVPTEEMAIKIFNNVIKPKIESM